MISSAGAYFEFHNKIISAIAEKRFMVVDKILSEMRGAPDTAPTFLTYNVIMGAYFREKWFDKIIYLFGEMRDHGALMDTTSYSMAISAYAKTKNISGAMHVFNEMRCAISDKGETKRAAAIPNVIIYNTILDMQIGYWKAEDFHALIDEMVRMRVQPDSDTFNILVRAFCMLGDLVLAKKYFSELCNAGYQPTRVTFQPIIDAYKRIGSDMEANKYQSQMIRTCGSRSRGSTTRGVLPNAVTSAVLQNSALANTRIHKLVKIGKMLEAEAVMVEMYETGIYPDQYSYTLILDGYCRKKDIQNTMRVYESMKLTGALPVRIYNSVIGMFLKLGNIAEAERILADMRAAGVGLDRITYCILIKYFTDTGNVERAEKLFIGMFKVGIRPDTLVYSYLINAYARLGNVNAIREIYSELINNGIAPDILIFSPIVEMYYGFGDIENALRAISDMMAHNINLDVNIYSMMLQIYINRNDVNSVERVLLDMENDQIQFTETMYRNLFSFYTLNEYAEGTYQILAEMESAGYISDIHIHNSALLVYAKSNRMDLMEGLFVRMTAVDHHTYEIVICSYIRDSNPAVAQIFINMIEEGFIPEWFLISLMLNFYLNEQDLDTVNLLLLRMTECGIEVSMSDLHKQPPIV